MGTALGPPAATALMLKKLSGQHVAAGRVVLYDGVCNLCNAGLRFVADRDPDKNVMFCSVQSHAAEAYLTGVGLTRQDVLRRFVFIEYRDWSQGSTAALQVAGYMQQPWPLLRAFLAVPLPVRDAVYDYIAANRYRWFGKSDYCQIPDADILDRFVDRDELVRGLCSDESMSEDGDKDRQ